MTTDQREWILLRVPTSVAEEIEQRVRRHFKHHCTYSVQQDDADPDWTHLGATASAIPERHLETLRQSIQTDWLVSLTSDTVAGMPLFVSHCRQDQDSWRYLNAWVGRFGQDKLYHFDWLKDSEWWQGGEAVLKQQASDTEEQ